MNISWKTALAIAASFLFVIALGVAVNWLISGSLLQTPVGTTLLEPEQVARAAQNIVVFQPPPDFEPDTAYEYLGTRMATYIGPDQSSYIFLYEAQAEPGISDAEMQEQFFLSINEDGGLENSVQVGTDMVTVAGRSIPVAIYESGPPEGQNYRTASAVIHTSPRRVVFVELTRPLERWSDVEARAFFESFQP